VSFLGYVAAASIGAGCAALASMVVRPTRGLAGRVRPYTIAARAALGHAPDVAASAVTVPVGGVVGRLFGPPLRAIAIRLRLPGSARGDAQLARLLRQAGSDMTTEEFRVRQIGTGAMVAGLGGVVAALVTQVPIAVLVTATAGFVVGSTRSRKRLERAVGERAARIRQELYTVNHLLAMHVRTGSGPIQAVQRVVDRGRGAVVDELGSLLISIRHGVRETDAFRRAADATPEPSAARTYQLLAASVERGADLGAALLSLSEDMRDSRREQLHKDAVKRRAAMLVPTIAILAPIMLLFIAAPLPSIVLGHR
jgi:tight adherence protein C